MGWRHYETLMNYKTVHPEATMEDYVAEMNRQIEFEEFLALLKQSVLEEMRTPEF